MTDTPTDPDEEDVDGIEDPEVPADLLNLSIDLDLAGVDPAEFGALFEEG
jgi:hypothetical protein